MHNTILSSFFDFAERHKLALHKVHKGEKRPVGNDWQTQSTKDRTQWEAWIREGYNVGVNPGASGIAICDVEAGNEQAFEAWFLETTGYAVPAPQTTSPSDGFHVYFRLDDSASFKKQGKETTGWGDLLVGNANAVCAPSYFANDPPKSAKKAGPYKWTAVSEIYDGAALRPALEKSAPKGTVDLSRLAPDDKPPIPGGRAEWVLREECEALRTLDGTGSHPVILRVSNHVGTHVGAGNVGAMFAYDSLADAFSESGVSSAGWERAIRDGLENGAATPAWPDRTIQEMFPPDFIRQVVADMTAKAGATLSTIRPRRISAASLDGKPVPERQWLVRDLIPAGNVTLLYGDGGTGKSLVALQLGVAVTAGTHFFGRPVAKGGVEFITAEDSLDEMHRRLTDIVRGSGVSLCALDRLHLTSLAEADALLAVPEDNRGGALVATALHDELDKLLAETRPAVLFLDTLADVYGGNEIIRSQARQFIGILRRLALAHGCTVIVLAHPSLSGMDKGTSGSTGWSNSVRSRLYLNRVHENDGSEPDEDLRVLRVGKLNYGRVGTEIEMRWQTGVFVPVAMATDPVLSDARAERVFLDLLTKYTAQGRNVSASTGANYAPKIFDAEARLQRVPKRTLAAAMGRLLDRGRIRNVEYGPKSRGTKRLEVVSTHNFEMPPPPV